MCVSFDEFTKAHEASTDSDDQLSVHNLGVDLSSSKEVETVAHPPDGHVYLHGVDVLGQQLVDLVALHSLVQVSLPLCHLVRRQNRRLFSESLLKAFDEDFFVSQNVLQCFKFLFFLLENSF